MRLGPCSMQALRGAPAKRMRRPAEKSRRAAGRPFSGHNSGSRMPGIAHVHGGAIRATVGMWPRRAPAHLPPVPTAPVHRSRRPCPGPVPPLMGAPPSPEGRLLSRRRHRTGRAAPAAAHLPLSPGATETSSGATTSDGHRLPPRRNPSRLRRSCGSGGRGLRRRRRPEHAAGRAVGPGPRALGARTVGARPERPRPARPVRSERRPDGAEHACPGLSQPDHAGAAGARCAG